MVVCVCCHCSAGGRFCTRHLGYLLRVRDASFLVRLLQLVSKVATTFVAVVLYCRLLLRCYCYLLAWSVFFAFVAVAPLARASAPGTSAGTYEVVPKRGQTKGIRRKRVEHRST